MTSEVIGPLLMIYSFGIMIGVLSYVAFEAPEGRLNTFLVLAHGFGWPFFMVRRIFRDALRTHDAR